MSQENVEVVRSGYSLLAGVSNQWGPITEFYADYCHPDVELVPPVSYPDTEPSYTGLDGFQSWRRQLDEMWDDWHFEPERFFDAGDRVVVFVRVSGTGKQSRAAVTVPTAHVFTLRDGLVARAEIFLDRPEALKAVGLAK